MHETLSGRRDEIAAACRDHRVTRLDLFGSGARGVDFDAARSDADFLVDFDEGYGADEFFGLKDALERVLGRSVDLVTRRGLECDAGIGLRSSIAEEGELVYAK